MYYLVNVTEVMQGSHGFLCALPSNPRRRNALQQLRVARPAVLDGVFCNG